jgi:hypothetical protein
MQLTSAIIAAKGRLSTNFAILVILVSFYVKECRRRFPGHNQVRRAPSTAAEKPSGSSRDRYSVAFLAQR